MEGWRARGGRVPGVLCPRIVAGAMPHPLGRGGWRCGVFPRHLAAFRQRQQPRAIDTVRGGDHAHVPAALVRTAVGVAEVSSGEPQGPDFRGAHWRHGRATQGHSPTRQRHKVGGGADFAGHGRHCHGSDHRRAVGPGIGFATFGRGGLREADRRHCRRAQLLPGQPPESADSEEPWHSCKAVAGPTVATSSAASGATGGRDLRRLGGGQRDGAHFESWGLCHSIAATVGGLARPDHRQGCAAG
mmetsp:Transcript_86761/g.268608  ORF Transcript_86761/g.268608 Transcript_86761/m.268608 type:complete len:244 (+) Transcript_86761:762-1493(+)